MGSLGITQTEIERARRVLMRRDPVLGAIIRRQGACGIQPPRESDIFCGLLRAIVSQQLSTKAAATIYARLCALVPEGGPPTPDALLPLADDQLRAVGLSRQKATYVRDLSQKVASGSLRTDALAAMSDEDIVTELTKIKGIGRWTAEMILIFRLARPDILPVDDLGIVKAVQNAYALKKRPNARRLIAIGQRWRPYRSIASWYLWASLDNK
jgi:DNA-3-methyladenine glycosylase II